MDLQTAKKTLLSRIAPLLRTDRPALVAIDGMAASGKTTLCAALETEIPGCFVIHMDDFTIPFEDRFPGYFDAQLSNADIARFDREVLSPLLAGCDAVYRPYRCHPEPGFLAPKRVPAGAACVLIEGAYCLHPRLFDRYDLRVLVTVSPELQKQRILARNGAQQLERFISSWIPMENQHIRAHRLPERCDLIIEASQDF